MLDITTLMGMKRGRYRIIFMSLLLAMSLTACSDSSPRSEAPAQRHAQQTKPPAEPLHDGMIRFTDVTAKAGIVFRHEAGASGHKWYPETMGAGGGFFDYDGDARLDILLINGRQWPPQRHPPEPTMQLFRNVGNGAFIDVTQRSKLNVPVYGMGMVAADYDNDGDQDLLVTGYQQTLLFRNEGDGSFTNVTQQSGIVQGLWSTAAVFVDVDRDGLLDLFIGHYVDWQPSKEEQLDCTYGTPQKDYCAVKFFQGQGLKLYRNMGSGRFQDVTAQRGVAAPQARVLGLTVTDYNQDGWPDLLVANDLTPSLFFANQGNGNFEEIGVQSGFVLDEGGVAFAGMGIDTAYINNDDQLCVAIGNFSGQPTTLHCQARIQDTYQSNVFIEQSHQRGLARPTLRMVTFGLFFFDADLDGWEDLFLANGHVVDEEHLRNVPYAQRPQLFHNDHRGAFSELPPAPNSGLDLRIIGRGAAYGDYDNDGDLDLLLTTNQSKAYLLRNDTPRQGHFLRVVTVGNRSNHNGIGAKLRLQTSTRQMTRMVRTGSSYLSQSELAATFGLSPSEQVEQLVIVWPSGTVDIFHPSTLDTTFTAHEGAAQVQAGQPKVVSQADIETPPFDLKHAAITHYRAGRLKESMQAFQLLRQQYPADYMVLQYLIELHWRQGEQKEGLRLLRQLTQNMPEANYLMQFAFQMEDVSLTPLANHIYQEVIRIDDKIPEAHYRLGKNALQAKQYDEAITHFRAALQRHAGFVDAGLGLALAYVKLGDDIQAERQFLQVIQVAPNDAAAYLQLGQLYQRTARLEKAAQAFKTAIRLQPQAAQGYQHLATISAAQGRPEEAIAHFRHAIRLDPQLSSAHNDLGTLYAEQGKFDLAIAAFKAARRIAPTSVPVLYNLALAYGAQGDRQGMLDALRETIRLQPQHHDAHLNLGIAFLQQGQIRAAIEHLKIAINIEPERAESHYFLAVAFAQTGQIDAMQTALHDTIRLNPNHARAHAMLASLYFQQHAYELANQHGQIAAQLGLPIQDLLEAIRKQQGPPQ